MSKNWRPGQAEAVLAQAQARGLVEAKYLVPVKPYAPGAAPAPKSPLVIPEYVELPPKPRRAKEPNQTEREYEKMLRRKHPDADIRWEPLTLRMASLCTYTPDFIVFLPNGSIECHEVKGAFVFPKALVKLRLAAETFPWRFVLAQKRRKTGWQITEIGGAWTRQISATGFPS